MLKNSAFLVTFVIMFVNETRLGEMLNKALLLSEAQAWLESVTPSLEKKIIRDWIQEDQLFKQGVDGNDEIIGLYSQATQNINPQKRAGTKFTLYDTGAFYRSMFVKVLRDSIIIEADPGEMIDQIWYDEEILGLNEENFSKFIEEIKFGFVEYVRRILGVDTRNAFG